MIVLHLAALILAIGFSPWLLARLFSQRGDRVSVMALWGAVMVGLNTAIPVLLHLGSIPITANSLSVAHLFLAMAIFGIFTLRPRHDSVAGEPYPPLLLLTFLIFSVLVIPFTHLAGIDTFKWQDLAGNVAAEGRISWLVHPLSLLGFTPRSYNGNAKPLVLASIQIMGHTGVDWGFYILSLALGFTGISGAWRLGLFLLPTRQQAAWFAFLYGLSPIFMRYNYWATGRGMLLALLPLYLLVLFRAPFLRRPHDHAPLPGLSWLLSLLAMTVLLAMSHKAGCVGILLIPALLLLSPALLLARGRLVRGLLLLTSLGAGFGLSGFSPSWFSWSLLTRFGFLLPLAIWGLATPPVRSAPYSVRGMLAAALALLPLSCISEMYGAMLALPFITFAAVIGVTLLNARWPKAATVLFMLSIAVACTIVINQALYSPTNAEYRTAIFLERYDPKGPFRISAPERIRTFVQAYVSGCPRFSVDTKNTSRITLRPPPVWTGQPIVDATRWIQYVRTVFDLQDSTTDWYGQGNRIYTITVNGEGRPAPPRAQ
ncbi:MAG: hypothetical protein WCG36_02945, partial [bacterium]